MLIEEIASTTTTTTNDEDSHEKETAADSSSFCCYESVVTECIESLIQHYRQPIHLCSHAFDNNDKDTTTTTPSPIVQQLLNKITLLSQQQTEMIGITLCHAYATQIRSVLFEPPSIHRLERRILHTNGIVVLMQYQTLVSNYLQQQQQHLLTSHDNNDDHEEKERKIDDLIILISCDITAVQAMHEEIANHPDATEQTPSTNTSTTTRVDDNQLELVTRCLLRLLSQILQQKAPTRHPSSSSSSSSSNALRRCTCTLMALECPRDPVSDSTILTDIDPSNTSIPDALLNMSQYLSFSQTGIPESPNISLPRLPKEILEWVGLMRNSSSCRKTETAAESSSSLSTLVQALWEQLADVVCGMHHATISRQDPNRIPYNNVIEYLGMESMSQTMRAHFFARDIWPEDMPVALPTQRLHLGHTITETKREDPMAKKPYQCNPSRCKATLYFLFQLKALNAEILDQILPIIYELLNASTDIHVGCGAACLFHLLNCQIASPKLWSHGPVADNLLSMLEKNIQICRKGPTLVLLGLAQRRLFQVLFTIDDRYRQRRRQATHQWLRILDRHSRHFTKDFLVWGLLVGGIVPLLYDHAVSDENADALEVGRLGLQALLPTIRGECGYDDLDGKSLWNAAATVYDGKDNDDMDLHSGDRGVLLSVAVSIPALVALSNLLMSAHPIMPRHAGKIICELVAFLRKHEWPPELEDEQCSVQKLELLLTTKRLASHVAAMAMVVCGEPASAIMNRILGIQDNPRDGTKESQMSNYDDQVVEIALQIKARAANLSNNTERNQSCN